MNPRRALLSAAAWILGASMALQASTPFVVSAPSPGDVRPEDSITWIQWPAGSSEPARLGIPADREPFVARVHAGDAELPASTIAVSQGRFRRLDVALLVPDRDAAARLAPETAGLPWTVALGLRPSGAPAATLLLEDLSREQDLLRTAGLLNEREAREILGTQASGRVSRARAKSLSADSMKISADIDGLVLVTHESLVAAGVTALGPVAELRLISRGLAAASREIAVDVRDGDGDGIFGPGDAFVFWAEALRGENVAGSFQGGDFTDVNAYFLDFESGSRLRVQQSDATPQPGSPALMSFLTTTRWEQDDLFFGNTRTGRAGVDHFVSCPALDVSSLPARTELVALPGLDVASSLPASMRVRLLARSGLASSPDHVSEIRAGAALVSRMEADGPTEIDHVATGLSASMLSDPLPVEIRLDPLPSGESMRADLNWIEVAYPRSFIAVDGDLVFDVAGPARVRVTGVGAGAEAWDVTDPVRPLSLQGLSRGAGSVELQVGAGPRRIAVASAPRLPLRVERARHEGLADPAQAADLLVIGPAAWTSPPLPGLQRYVAWREAQGVRVRVASVEAAIDELNDGLFSPAAVSRLVASAMNSWSSPPTWVLLLGDASLDHKNRLGGRLVDPSTCNPASDPCGRLETAWVQHVPTHLVDVPADLTYLGYLASDSLYAMASGGDWMPDVALGRLPARDAAGIEAMLDKIVEYERLADAPPEWASRYVTVADKVIPGQEIIEASQDEAAAAIPDCYERETLFYQRGWGGTDATGFTAELLSVWTDPARSGAVMSYVGHGSTFNWSSDQLLTNAGVACRNDVDALVSPGDPLPILLNADCVAAGFMHASAPSLLEELVRAPNGGAIAAFGPTGVTDLAFAGPIVEAFYDAIYGPRGRGERLGHAILAVQAPLASAAASGSPEQLMTNVLLGDPSLRLVIPFGPPAGGIRAVIDGADVLVEWDAVPGATAYRLHRSESGLQGPFVVAADGLTGTSHRLSGLPHARIQHVAVEPLDGCLPGRWSDAVPVTPCDPGQAPGAPADLMQLSGGCDGTALLQWTPSATAGVRHVLSARRPGSSVPEREQVVTGSFGIFSGLVPFRDYDVTVTALDDCGFRSAPSAMLRVRLECALRVDAPAFIPDLRVSRQGADIALSWGAVDRTIQDAPLSPAAYLVHRSDQPDFIAAASVVDRVTVPAAILPGRVGNGTTLEFYAVSAEDASGLSGPVGHDLPQGIRGLSRADAGADYRLTWNPVRHDIRGERTAISHYEVFASMTPLARPDADFRTPDAIVTQPEALVPQALGPYHLVVSVDVHGNRGAW